MLAFILLVVAVAIGDYVLLSRRVSHVHVTFPASGTGQTWVVVGSDSRASLPSGPDIYGAAGEDPGQTADVVLVIHQYAGRTVALSIPRDILVVPANDQLSRLALTLNQSPQSLVNGLCTTLHIPTTHLVIVTMSAFTRIIDVLGGVTVNIPYPIRDDISDLHLSRTGYVTLNGFEALALVRSRHPEQLIGSQWVPASQAAGSVDRTYWAGQIFTALRKSADRAQRNPITAQRVLWAATDGMMTDQNTSLWDLKNIDQTGTHVTDLPVNPVANGLAVTANSATRQVLGDAGYGQVCRVPAG